jgi:predicted aspartyl protease
MDTTAEKLLVRATLQNLEDLYQAEQGHISADEVRTIEVFDALVDIGATTLRVPSRLIAQLGLRPFGVRQICTPTGVAARQRFNAVRLTIQGRQFTCDVTEDADDKPVRIDRISLHGLDLVIDPIGQRLIGNPEHRDQDITDM